LRSRPEECGSRTPPEARRAARLLFEVQDRGEYTQAEVAELFSVSRATVYRELQERRSAFLATREAHIF